MLTDKEQSFPKKLTELKSDAAFREFFRLQEGFQGNGVLQSCLDSELFETLTVAQLYRALYRRWND